MRLRGDNFLIKTVWPVRLLGVPEGGKNMKIFTGDSSGRKTVATLKEAGIGRFFIRGPRTLYDGEEYEET
jgi:hypothetical protein